MRRLLARLLRRGRGRVELRRWSLMLGSLGGERLVTFTSAARDVPESQVLAETLAQLDIHPRPRLRVVRWELRRESGGQADEWRIVWEVEPGSAR